jgi:hypothetical protein
MDYTYLSCNASSSAQVMDGSCPYCGQWAGHTPSSCPLVRAVEYYPDGTIKRIERFSPRELYTPPPEVTPTLSPVPYTPFWFPTITNYPNMC